MSDEAFCTAVLLDRAELLALGVPLHSQRDEFTGEELYTLRSEQYFPRRSSCPTRSWPPPDVFLPARGAVRVRRAAPPGAAEPGARPTGFAEALTDTGGAGGDARPRLPRDAGPPGEAEAAISKQRTIRFQYWSISRDEVSSGPSTPTRCSRTTRCTWSAATSTGRTSGVPFRASAATSALATRRERLPRSLRLQRGRAPRLTAVAGRRHPRRGEGSRSAATPLRWLEDVRRARTARGRASS